MGSQLRWILLGLGIALVAGLWWWEKRRAAAPLDEVKAPPRQPPRFEPRLDGEATAVGASDDEDEPTALEAPIRVLDEHPVPHGDPPLVTLDDLPENTDSVVLAPVPPPEERAAPLQTSAMERRRTRPDPPPPPEAPVVASEPVVEAPVAPAPPEPEPPSRQQRIVAIRLIGDRERRIEGGALRKAIAAEGLEFGRYSIFHRLVPGGRPVFSVASLVEPGSFDLDRMGEASFPGISFFAVFPGPQPAPQVFDEMLATARRLAERLDASLQDDAGSSLTGQRVLSIREELVHFEHLVSLSRARPAG